MSNLWLDLGSDVNWEEYGGCWGCPNPENSEEWVIIRLDVEDSGAYAVVARVDVSQVSDSDLQTCDVPLDGLNEFGEEIPKLAYYGEKVRAYIMTWGASGVAGGSTFISKTATQALKQAKLNYNWNDSDD